MYSIGLRTKIEKPFGARLSLAESQPKLVNASYLGSPARNTVCEGVYFENSFLVDSMRTDPTLSKLAPSERETRHTAVNPVDVPVILKEATRASEEELAPCVGPSEAKKNHSRRGCGRAVQRLLCAGRDRQDGRIWNCAAAWQRGAQGVPGGTFRAIVAGKGGPWLWRRERGAWAGVYRRRI
ncbi:hypothetical protein BJV74DRAFT_798971 [Russula compacta]|nr:hypothetical protein BJV74DRAFT_798971 [Russula compacta]